MPLLKLRKPRSKDRCRAHVSDTISTLMHEGRPQDQAVAIALSHARRQGCRLPDTRGQAAGKAPRPPKGTPTTGDLYCLHVELDAHKARTGHAEPLFAFAATCVGAMRKLLKAGYLAPAFGRPQGHWELTGQGLAAYEGWRERHAGFYGIPEGYRRDQGRASGKVSNAGYGQAPSRFEATSKPVLERIDRGAFLRSAGKPDRYVLEDDSCAAVHRFRARHGLPEGTVCEGRSTGRRKR